MKGILHGCSNYEIALGMKMHSLTMKDWLFSSIRVRTHADAGTLFAVSFQQISFSSK